MKGLPQIPKQVIYVAIIIAVILIVRSLVKGVGQLQDKVDTAILNKTPTSDTSTQTSISNAEARAIADRQWSAMDGFGTDENSLFASLKGLNGKDLQKVFTSFGKRPYFGIGGSVLFATDQDLFSWYSSELDKSEMAQMAKVWEKSGLKFPA
jgi:hypothetical protein